MIIYKTTNKINKMCYIGQDVNNNSNYLGSGIFLNNAIKKYGKENFKKDILCECNTREDMNEKEKFYIKKYKTKRPNGYNLTDGGEGNLGWIPSDETKNKISNSIKNWWRNITNEERQYISKVRSKINSGERNPMFGRKRPDIVGSNNPSCRPEVREKLKFRTKDVIEKLRLLNIKYLYEAITPSGEKIIFNSVYLFAKQNNLNRSGIQFALKNKKLYKGYKFKILEKLNAL